jgi:hypothetical protein
MGSENQTDLLAAVLDLKSPWKIEIAEVDIDRRRVVVRVGFERGGRFVCVACGFGGAVAYDSAPAAWRLKDGLAGWVTEIRARVPRVRCPECGRVRRVAMVFDNLGARMRKAKNDG